MDKRIMYKVIGAVLAAAGAIVASKSNSIELEQLVNQKLNEEETNDSEK